MTLRDTTTLHERKVVRFTLGKTKIEGGFG